MPIKGQGWEFHIVRKSVQKNPDTGRRRTVGTYQIFHDGAAQTGAFMKGMVAECRGPGANAPAGNGLRIEQGRYPLATQSGAKYMTIGYKDSESLSARPRPGFELLKTGKRQEILIHPGTGFLASIGCINPCKSLPSAGETIDFVPSRKRVIAIIEDMKAFLGGGFPTKNGKAIPNAAVVIDGEP